MRTNSKLNPHMTPSPGIESRPHWWEASALTTTPAPPPPPYNINWHKWDWNTSIALAYLGVYSSGPLRTACYWIS